MKKQLIGLTALGIIMLTNYSCKKTETPVPVNTNKANYALSVTGGNYPNQTTYLFGSNLFPTGSVGTGNAAELTSSGQMYKYGTNVYINTFGAPATLRKYEFDEAGKPKQTGSFSVPGLKTFGTVDFISETEAYAASNGYGGIPKLVKFNPTTMQITGTIDMSSTHKAASVGGDYYLGMVHRDNNLFMGITYTNASGDPLYDSVFVAVIDKVAGTVTKVLADGRSGEMWTGGSDASFSPPTLVKDANNDIYVMGFASNGKPSGVLKIKNGTTDFDASYFFNLNTATGKPCLGLYYFGSGQVFTMRYADAVAYPFDLDASYNPLAAAEYYKIDLTAKTSLGNIAPTLPKLFGVSTFMTKWDNEKIYFNAPAATSNAVYSYQLSNGTVKKEFELSAGQCNGFTKLN
ncbi:MAG: hypothetical protein ABJA37_06600 [Ferruginibacter sp.]